MELGDSPKPARVRAWHDGKPTPAQLLADDAPTLSVDAAGPWVATLWWEDGQCLQVEGEPVESVPAPPMPATEGGAKEAGEIWNWLCMRWRHKPCIACGDPPLPRPSPKERGIAS